MALRKTLAISLFLFSSHVKAQDSLSLKYYDAKGKVKSITEKIYMAQERFGVPTKLSLKKEVTTFFDEKGNVKSKSASHFKDKEVNDSIVSIRVTKLTDYFSYEDNKLAKKVTLNNSGDTLFVDNYMMGSNGNLDMEVLFDSTHKMIMRKLCKYENKGAYVLCNETKYFFNSKELSKKKLDLKGNVIEDDASGFLVKKAYNTNNKCIKMSAGSMAKASIKYDKSGLEIESDAESFEGVRRVTKHTYKMDAKGNYVYKCKYSGAGHDNIKTEATEITERVIDYL